MDDHILNNLLDNESGCHSDESGAEVTTEIALGVVQEMALGKTPEVAAQPADEANTFLQQLDNLKSEGMHRYDPVRFGFIDSLARRTAVQRGNVQQLLESKVQLALDNYLVDRESARVKSESIISTAFVSSSDDEVSTVSASVSQLAMQAKDYHEQGDFNKVQQLVRQWQCGTKAEESTNNIVSALAELRQYLADPLVNEVEGDKVVSASGDFTKQLRRQDKELLNDSSHSFANGLERNTNAGLATPTITALKSSQVYQQFQEKKRVDNFIDIAFNETPENPGPLNPEILAIRLLKEINSLSPEYMSRYAGYFETLQWLNKSGS